MLRGTDAPKLSPLVRRGARNRLGFVACVNRLLLNERPMFRMSDGDDACIVVYGQSVATRPPRGRKSRHLFLFCERRGLARPSPWAFHRAFPALNSQFIVGHPVFQGAFAAAAFSESLKATAREGGERRNYEEKTQRKLFTPPFSFFFFFHEGYSVRWPSVLLRMRIKK